MTAEAMWREFCAATGTDEQTPHDAWAFCGGGPMADELAALVLAGVKTATASAMIAYETEHETPPAAGCYSVVLWDSGAAAAVIRDTRVSLVPFCAVPAEHASREGVGSRTLAVWREIHRRVFTPDYRAAGKEFDETGLCVLEEFELLWPRKSV